MTQVSPSNPPKPEGWDKGRYVLGGKEVTREEWMMHFGRDPKSANPTCAYSLWVLEQFEKKKQPTKPKGEGGITVKTKTASTDQGGE